MTEEEKIELIGKAKYFFKVQIFENHIKNGCSKASKLKNYNINPFLIKYQATFIEGNCEARSIAKALVYPRLLGTSINTSFGQKTQKMISTIFGNYGSMIDGADIQFVDYMDGRQKYCQLKAGPDTINSGDIKTITDHFVLAKNRARANHIRLADGDLFVGVLYGKQEDLNSHYQSLQNHYPIYVGKDFWYRLTGDENFYSELIDAIAEVAIEIDCASKIDEVIDNLTEEIEREMI